MTSPFEYRTVTSLVYLLSALAAACGNGGTSASPVSCDEFQAKFNACDKTTKDAVAAGCPKMSDECRRCILGLPDVCKNTEACDPQCKPK